MKMRTQALVAHRCARSPTRCYSDNQDIKTSGQNQYYRTDKNWKCNGQKPMYATGFLLIYTRIWGPIKA